MKTIQLETEGYQPPKSGLILLQCLVGLLFFTFVIRFWYLQIHRGADFAQQAQANHLRQESVYASRGLIRDVKGTLLAENRPAFGLALIREDCKDISSTLAQVSEWAGIPLEQLANRFQQDRRKVKPFEPILLLNDMPFDQVARIEAQLMHWPGLEIVTRSKRYYPEGKEFAHILGYVAEANERELAADPYLALGDTVGKQGLEYVFAGTRGCTTSKSTSLGVPSARRWLKSRRTGKTFSFPSTPSCKSSSRRCSATRRAALWSWSRRRAGFWRW